MKKRLKIAPSPDADRELVAKAVVRAADFLGLTQSGLEVMRAERPVTLFAVPKPAKRSRSGARP